MRKNLFLLAGLALAALTLNITAPPRTAVATNAIDGTATGKTTAYSQTSGGLYQTTLPTLSNNDRDAFELDSRGRLIVAIGANTAGATSQSAAGDIAHDAVDSGNPVKIGGKAQTFGGSVAAVSSLDRVDANFDLNGALRVVPALPDSSWSITNAAAVNTVATATQAAAAAGVKHVCTGLQVKPWQDATGTITTATGYTVALRDGASGAGTIKWSETFSFPVTAAGEIKDLQVTFPTPIVGTAATAMCVEITSSALLHTGCTVNAQGYDTK